MSPARRLCLALLATLPLLGCETAPRRDTPPERVPTYDALVRAHNQRVENLDRVWARATVVIDSPDGRGGTRRDQGEGHLQVVRPRNVALSVGKLGETGFYLGSNDERYWWFDLRGSDEGPMAYVGSHAGARDAAAAQMDAPVHPLDLIDVLGVQPLPEREAPTGPGERVWPTEDGLLQIVLPARLGYRLLSFEPGTLRLRRVELYSDDAELLLIAELERYGPVRLVEGGGNWPEMPDRVRLDAPGEGVAVTLTLYGLENRGSRQSMAPFDLDRLLRAYRIDEVVDLDEERGR